MDLDKDKNFKRRSKETIRKRGRILSMGPKDGWEK